MMMIDVSKQPSGDQWRAEEDWGARTVSSFFDISVLIALSRFTEAVLRPAMMPISVLKLFIFRRHCGGQTTHTDTVRE